MYESDIFAPTAKFH